MDESEVEVTLVCSLNALRVMHRVAADAHRNWPGGHPEEQLVLEKLKTSLYSSLMDALLHNKLL